MISTRTAKLINILPIKFVTYVSKRLVNKYLNKYATVHIKGKENLTQIKTPTIFICNHLSNSDGLVLNRVLEDIDLTFVAGVKLSKNAITSLGVNVIKTTSIKPNTADKEGLNSIIGLIEKGESLLIFPEGTRSRVGSLIEAKKGIIYIAQMTGAPIVPLGLYGTEKLLPINQDGNMSLEKFDYADVYIHIGEQFDFPKRVKGQSKKDYRESSANFMMKRIAELLPEQYRGVYK